MRTFTENEKQEFNQAANELATLGLICTDDDKGKHNTAIVKAYLEANPRFQITVASVKNVVLGELRNQMMWKSAAQQAADNAAASLTQDEVNTILAWLPTHGLKSDGDNLLTNFAIVAGWMSRNNRAISYSELNTALTSYLVNSPAGSGLRWVKKLQDSEKEAQRQRDEAAKTPARQQRTELVNNNPEVRPLSGVLEAHRRMLHRQADGKPAAPETTEAEWQSKAEAALSNTSSNLDRNEAKRFFPGNVGVTSWQDAYRKRVQYLEKRKVERQNAGR